MSEHPWRGRALGWGIGWTAKLAPRLLPRQLLVVPELVVLMHPRPTTSRHLLLLARNRSAGLDGSLMATASAVDAMLNEVTAQAHADFARPEHVVAVVNGGIRQDVRLLHMHLFADPDLAAALHEAEAGRAVALDGHLGTSCPLQYVHRIYDRTAIEPDALVADVRRIVAARHASGYSLMARAVAPSIVHLVGSGDERPESAIKPVEAAGVSL